VSYLYDATTGECLGCATDEQETEDAQRPGRFLVYWEPGSCLHGRVLDDEQLPVGFIKAREVRVFSSPGHYLAPFGGQLVWHCDS